MEFNSAFKGLKELRRFHVYVVWYDMHGAMYRVASIRFTYSSVARRRMRIVLWRCDVIILKKFSLKVV